MKSARKMFEELGYEVQIIGSDRTFEYYNSKLNIIIDFDLEDKEFNIGENDYDVTPPYISMPLLKAINKQCEELRVGMMSKEDISKKLISIVMDYAFDCGLSIKADQFTSKLVEKIMNNKNINRKNLNFIGDTKYFIINKINKCDFYDGLWEYLKEEI